MYKSENVMELLSSGKNILRELHGTHGFNFEKPFGVIRIDGKFTAKSVLKLIEENGFKADACDCVVLLHGVLSCRFDEIRRTGYFKAVGFNNYWRGNWEFYTDVNPKRSFNSYRLACFCTKSDFELSRKNSDIAYVVVQAREHMTRLPKAHELDKLSRVKLLKVHRSDGRIIKLKIADETGKEFTYYVPYWVDDSAKLSDIIDGSGYIVAEHRSALLERLNEFIAKREREAASAIDYSENIATLELLLAAKKIMLIEKLKAAKTSDELYDVERKISDHRWFVERVELFKKNAIEKTFTSVDNSTNAYNNLVARLSE